MATLDSTRLFEISELPGPSLPLTVLDQTIISRAGRSGPAPLGEVVTLLKTTSDAAYMPLPSALAAGKGGQVPVVAPNGLSLLWSGSTNGPLAANIALGSGAQGSSGSGTPSKSITGHGRSGRISVTTANTPLANNVIATVTFPAAFPAAPRVFITPGNDKAAQLALGAYVSSTTATTFVISSSTTALTTGQPYIWNYLIEL